MPRKEKALAQTRAKSRTNLAFNLAYPSNFIKSKRDQVARSFWIANYGIEEARQDHAARGHLWKQILYCLALLVFRMIGRLMS